jgi:hypothetical protein
MNFNGKDIPLVVTVIGVVLLGLGAAVINPTIAFSISPILAAVPAIVKAIRGDHDEPEGDRLDRSRPRRPRPDRRKWSRTSPDRRRSTRKKPDRERPGRKRRPRNKPDVDSKGTVL